MEHEADLELTQRELSEIRFSMVYARWFNHGTAGHNGYLLTAKLAERLGIHLLEDDSLILPSDITVLEKPERPERPER